MNFDEAKGLEHWWYKTEVMKAQLETASWRWLVSRMVVKEDASATNIALMHAAFDDYQKLNDDILKLLKSSEIVKKEDYVG